MNEIDRLRRELKTHMVENDLTISVVAQALDRHYQTVANFLRSRNVPTERTLYKIRAYLGRAVAQ